MEDLSKTALVTGATGFIGGRLTERLVADGWSVKVLVRDAARLAPTLRAATEVVGGDLADVAALDRAVEGVSVIFHGAANVRTWDRWEAYEVANVEGVKNLLQAIATKNPGLSRLVHLSSMDVYGFPKTPCNEQGPTPARGFGYGDSKRLGENLVREFCSENHIPYVVIRPGNVIGPGSQFIERIGEELRSGLMLTIDGGRANAGILHIDNLIDYLLWAASDPKAVGQFYNVRDDYDVSWAEFLAAFRKRLDGRGIIIDLPFAVAYASGWAMEGLYRLLLPSHEPLLHRLLVCIFGRTCGHDAGKIRAASGIGSEVRLDEALEKSVRWFRREKAAK